MKWFQPKNIILTCMLCHDRPTGGRPQPKQCQIELATNNSSIISIERPCVLNIPRRRPLFVRTCTHDIWKKHYNVRERVENYMIELDIELTMHWLFEWKPWRRRVGNKSHWD